MAGDGEPTTIVECVSCDGYGWLEDEDGVTVDCGWCGGIGYVYRNANGHDRRIPEADFSAVGEQLEALETARLQRLGYSGTAKKPWEQAIRQGRINPPEAPRDVGHEVIISHKRDASPDQKELELSEADPDDERG